MLGVELWVVFESKPLETNTEDDLEVLLDVKLELPLKLSLMATDSLVFTTGTEVVILCDPLPFKLLVVVRLPKVVLSTPPLPKVVVIVVCIVGSVVGGPEVLFGEAGVDDVSAAGGCCVQSRINNGTRRLRHHAAAMIAPETIPPY